MNIDDNNKIDDILPKPLDNNNSSHINSPVRKKEENAEKVSIESPSKKSEEEKININNNKKKVSNSNLLYKHSNEEKSILIWIDKDVDSAKNINYKNELTNKNKFNLFFYKDVDSTFNKIKEIKFIETYIIISGEFYQPFILKFKDNLKEIYHIPKFIIFTDKEINSIKGKTITNEIYKDDYYGLGGIQTDFEKVMDFLFKEIWKKKINVEKIDFNNFGNLIEEMTFEYIDTIEKLYLPVYYKALIKINENDNFDRMTQYIYEKYSGDEKDVKDLFGHIEGLIKIPYELLCKYYARLYTLESSFYQNINKYLRKQNPEEISKKYTKMYIIPFIKLLFEGIRLKCFKLCFNGTLYRFQIIKKDEIQKIKEYLKNKKDNIPGAICFSKAFLSFTKDRNVANDFYEMNKKKINDMNIPVFFILDKNEKMNNNFSYSY